MRTGHFCVVLAWHFADKAGLLVRSEPEPVDIERRFAMVSKELGFQDLVQGSSAPSDKRCVVDGGRIGFILCGTGYVQV